MARDMTSARLAAEPRLLVPESDVEDPEVSIVVPALNEEITIEEFVRWCHQGLAAAGVFGEILIVDSSTDAHRRARGGRGRTRAANAEAWSRAGLHRRHPVHSRPLRDHGRRRLHVRLPPARSRSSTSSARATSS